MATNTPDDATLPDSAAPLDLSVEVTCDTCRKTTTFQVNRDRYTAWRGRRMLMQDALQHLSPPDREYLKSRICPDCWTAMFGPN
ncbi:MULTISPECIES: hypothetical protein [unclassified Nocardia]|uniref:hypothetical protein n=1 Tax=unclassified Nocardia TaxID=2637762 RepID=UPI001CE3FCA9|nr:MULTISPECIES: hypothetical protein [unclassified Nocardia]